MICQMDPSSTTEAEIAALAIEQREKRLLSAHYHYLIHREDILKKKRSIEKVECPQCGQKYVRWYLQEHIDRRHSAKPEAEAKKKPDYVLKEYKPMRYTDPPPSAPARPRGRPRKVVQS